MKPTRSQVKMAFTLAYANYMTEHKKFYHVTLAYVGNRYLDFGVNKTRTHPMLREYGYNTYSLIHSELDLLIKLQKLQNIELRDIDIINFRFNNARLKNGNKFYGKSRPCKHCAMFVTEFKSVTFFTTEWETIKY